MNEQNCICGCPADQHKRFGCARCTCLAFQSAATTNEAWILLGCELLHGEVVSRDGRSSIVSFEPDGGEPLFVPATAIAYTPEQVRTKIAGAVTRLGKIAQEFDAQFERAPKGA